MQIKYNSNYPSIDDLRKKAKRNIPRFAFENLDGGCNEDVNLYKNTAELRDIELKPFYLKAIHRPTCKQNCLVMCMMHPLALHPLVCRA